MRLLGKHSLNPGYLFPAVPADADAQAAANQPRACRQKRQIGKAQRNTGVAPGGVSKLRRNVRSNRQYRQRKKLQAQKRHAPEQRPAATCSTCCTDLPPHDAMFSDATAYDSIRGHTAAFVKDEMLGDDAMSDAAGPAVKTDSAGLASIKREALHENDAYMPLA